MSRGVECERTRPSPRTFVSAVFVVASAVLMYWFEVAWWGHVALVVASISFALKVRATTADRHNVARHAVMSMLVTLAITWSLAVAATAVGLRVFPRESVLTTLLFSSTTFGSFFALQRSAQTRSETAAGLKEIGGLRVAVLSTPLVEQQVAAMEAQDVVVLLQVAMRMLAVTNAPKLPNTYAEDGVFLCTGEVQRHPWFRPAGGGTAVSLVVVLIRVRGRLLGALSLTSRERLPLPLGGSQRVELIETLGHWNKSFAILLRRIYDQRYLA